jgi:hypothetical protein
MRKNAASMLIIYRAPAFGVTPRDSPSPFSVSGIYHLAGLPSFFPISFALIYWMGLVKG